MFELSPNIDKNKIFLVKLSDIEGRLDPIFYNANTQKFIKGKYQITTIKNIANNIKSGVGAGKQDQSDKQNGIIQIRPTNITNDGFLKFDKNIYLPADKNTDKVYENDVLFNNTNSQELVGKTAIAHNINGYFYSNHITKITTNSSIDPKYLWILLNAYQRNKIFYSICTNWNNQSGIGIELLKSLKIPLPPKEIQQQIIDIYETAYKTKQQKEAEAEALLNSIDDYLLGELGITLPKKDNSLENRIFKVNFSEVTGKRWDAFYFQTYYKSNIEKIIKGKYQTTLLKNIINGNLIKGNLPNNDQKNGKNKVIQIGSIDNNGDIDFTNLLTAKDIFTVEQKLKKGDVIIVITGATIGKISFWDYEGDYYLGGDLVKFQTKDKVNPFYIFSILRTSPFQVEIERNVTGTTNGHLAPFDIEHFTIPIPPIEKQNEIAEHIKSIREQAKQLKIEAKQVLEQAKQEVEKMILGEL